MPVWKTGTNVGRLHRAEAARKLKLSKKEIHKAYSNWILIFRMDGSTLTFEQYLNKLDAAGIRPFDLGNGINDFHLARVNDDGPYTNDTCRFITKRENLAEQVRENPWDRTVKKYGIVRAREMARENGRLAQWSERKSLKLRV